MFTPRLTAGFKKILARVFDEGIVKNQNTLNQEFLDDPLKLEDAISFTRFDLDSARLI